jgi:alpha-1,3-glucan synthase
MYPYISSGDAYPESGPGAQSNQDYERVVTSRPITPNLNDFASSQLSLASVTAGRDDFALFNVEDHFTDADGKYLKQFSLELCDLDSKTSIDDLCIREYIVRSEKQWADDMRNKKLGFHSLCHHRRPSTQSSDDRPMSVSPPESLSEEPLLRYKPPKGMRRFLQRRIGDWPFYSLLLALVSFLQNVVNG